MKLLVVVILTVVAVSAEPPRYRQRPRFQKQEVAPYPPSGWRPSGAEFRLPARQELLPEKYGPPSQTYGPPSPTYGPPPTTTEEPTTTEIPTTTEYPDEQAQKLSEKLRNKEKEAEEVEVNNEANQKEQPQLQGVYYLLLPGGQLSKVQYVTTGDVNSAYTAQLQYQEVPPIVGPIYGFNENGQLVQLL